MQLLTKNTDYAIRALIYLARNDDRYVSSREISKEDRIPLPYLRRILQRLSREGIIVTREGASGGIKLAKPPQDIRVTQVMELFQGEVQLVKCMFRKVYCHNRENCVLRKRLRRIEENVIAELKDITIGSLVDDINKQQHG